MSASSARRLKDRGAAAAAPAGVKVGATLKPSKQLTPISISISISEKRSSSTGKENPPAGSTFRTSAQKPMIRPVPRVDKASVSAATSGGGGDTRTRWSMSSAPRGRSSSPSEFLRVFSHAGKERRGSVDRAERCPGLGSVGESDRVVSSAGRGLSRVRGSASGKQRKGFRDLDVKVSEMGANRIRVLRDMKESSKISASSEKKSGHCAEFEVKSDEKSNLSSDLKIPGGVGGNRTLDSCNSSRSSLAIDTKDQNLVRVDAKAVKVGPVGVLGLKESREKSLSNGKVLEISKGKGLSEEGSNGGSASIKYPSRLHEKLAFLEGKVKRIASDIKKTKEILDKNNPDTSKVILSDIQEKISGIEKAMGHVPSGSDGKMGLPRSTEHDDQVSKIVEKGHIEQVGNAKSLLNSEDLEARLFPHHKLLRNRTALKESSESSQSHGSQIVKTLSESRVDGKSLSLIDDDPIAMEFLASLNKDQTDVTTRDGDEDLKCFEVQEVEGVTAAEVEKSSKLVTKKNNMELILTTDETLDEFDDQENRQDMIIDEENEDTCMYQLNGIGQKTSTGGWFVSEGESVLLAHDDSSCSFYDIVNCEEKVVYKPPEGVSPNMWRDCWIIRAPSADGCSGRYVVAASAGNTMDSGFCSWDFYAKDVHAFHIEDGSTLSRTALAPLPNNITFGRNAFSNLLDPEPRQWWYRPSGPLIVSTASGQRVVSIYDIRDGEQVMKWDVAKPVITMDNSSPLQWRNRGKVVVAEAETISLWDVNSLNPQALLSVSSSGRKISALHVNNTDAEIGGGVRQRVSSSEAEGNDGVFCTQDSINILDFRHPSGVGLRIPKLGINVQSVFSRGDSILLGCSSARAAWKKQASSQVQQFSLRKQRLYSTYALPESNAHSHCTAITQVWGNSNLVMGVCGLGLFVFDALKDDGVPLLTNDDDGTQNARESIGPDDLYSPSFDYLDSRALLISRDRPAVWRHLS